MAVWGRIFDSTHELEDKIQNGLLLSDQARSRHWHTEPRAYDVFGLCLSDIKLGHCKLGSQGFKRSGIGWPGGWLGNRRHGAVAEDHGKSRSGEPCFPRSTTISNLTLPPRNL
jgi:hypothetical protein